MIIGVPKEIMIGEGRVAATPEGVEILVKNGHQVLVGSSAGKSSGFSDDDFLKAGAVIENNPALIYQADLVVKIKEPQEKEYPLLKERGIIFAFLHLPANPELVKVIQEKGITAIAYENIRLENGQRPILKPMSKIAGERAVREGMVYLEKNPRDIKVAVLGAAGSVGQSAIKTAQELGASITALDLPGKGVKIATPDNIQAALKEADLFIGAVAIPGKGAPKLVTRKMVASMKLGSVIVDVAIDEGGCIETSRPTTHDKPTFLTGGVIHYCVKNMPGAVPKISTPALTSATFPYILEIANKGVKEAAKENPALAKGINIY